MRKLDSIFSNVILNGFKSGLQAWVLVVALNITCITFSIHSFQVCALTYMAVITLSMGRIVPEIALLLGLWIDIFYGVVVGMSALSFYALSSGISTYIRKPDDGLGLVWQEGLLVCTYLMYLLWLQMD